MNPQQTLRILATALMLAVGAVMPRVAAAHAFPVGASPRVGCTLDSPPAEVVIDFDSPIESLFTKLEVLDRAGHKETIGDPAVSHDQCQLSVRLGHLAPGEFTVRWSVVSRDGHRTEGSYNFTLKDGGP